LEDLMFNVSNGNSVRMLSPKHELLNQIGLF